MACTALHTLYADQCSLHEVPPAALQLPNLAVLGLCSNAIDALPDALTQLTALSALDLRNNALMALPPQLCLLPLRSLLVEGNILRTIRRPILERGTPALLTYLNDRMPT